MGWHLRKKMRLEYAYAGRFGFGQTQHHMTQDEQIPITDADLESEDEEVAQAQLKSKKQPKKKADGVQKKKKSPPKVSPIVIKQRKEVVEKRIQQLEIRLARDKALQQQYVESLIAAEAALAEAAAAASAVITDETTRDAVAV